MVKINPRSGGIYHRLTALKQVNEMNAGDVKDVLIMRMTDGRLDVMGLFMMTPDGIINDCFRKIFNTEQDLHESFDEATTNMVGFS